MWWLKLQFKYLNIKWNRLWYSVRFDTLHTNVSIFHFMFKEFNNVYVCSVKMIWSCWKARKFSLTLLEPTSVSSKLTLRSPLTVTWQENSTSNMLLDFWVLKVVISILRPSVLPRKTTYHVDYIHVPAQTILWFGVIQNCLSMCA